MHCPMIIPGAVAPVVLTLIEARKGATGSSPRARPCGSRHERQLRPPRLIELVGVRTACAASCRFPPRRLPQATGYGRATVMAMNVQPSGELGWWEEPGSLWMNVPGPEARCWSTKVPETM